MDSRTKGNVRSRSFSRWRSIRSIPFRRFPPRFFYSFDRYSFSLSGERDKSRKTKKRDVIKDGFVSSNMHRDRTLVPSSLLVMPRSLRAFKNKAKKDWFTCRSIHRLLSSTQDETWFKRKNEKGQTDGYERNVEPDVVLFFFFWVLENGIPRGESRCLVLAWGCVPPFPFPGRV